MRGKSGGEKKIKPNKIQNSKCGKLCDAQAHAYKHMHNVSKHTKEKNGCWCGWR